MEQLLGAIRGFGVGRLAALLGVGAGVAGTLAALTLNLGAEPKALLYSNMDLKEAAQVTQALDQAGVKYEVRGDGSTIMVSRDEVASTRLLISGKGLVTSGSVGYEIFDQSNSLGQTDFVQQLNRQRALEGELARTIRALDGVTFARVHLVLPKRQLFEEEAESPAASVTIGVAGRKPSADQVAAVQNLVAGAVPNLKAERVTIVDQHGKTLSAGGDSSLAGKLADDRRSEVEERIREQVKNLVEGVVGPGKARVTVSAALDLNRVTEQQETFDPDGQVIRSEQTTEESAAEQEPGGADVVTAAANIPGGLGGPEGDLTSSTSGRMESTTNYEISKVVRTEIREPGAVRKLSVAVAVDGTTAAGADGAPGDYEPRAPEEMQRLEQLVRAAVGYDESRGDVVTVVNVRFPREALTGGTEAGNPLMDFDKNDIMRAVELAVLAVIALLILLFGVRPLLKGIGGAGGGLPMLASAAGGAPTTHLVAAPDGGAMQLSAEHGGEALALPRPDMEQRIDIARIEGQVKASSVKRVSEFVDKHPEDSVSILRSWLHETT